MNRVFSNFQIRSIDDDQRIIEGIASTPRIDRAGDIVESQGAAYELPIPFLLDHDHTLAVGEVELAEVTATGIRFRARIKKISEPGAAKDLVDKAWSLLKAGLRKYVSIGFRPIEYEMMAEGGARFLSWEWLELSACAIPAQPDAKIIGLKSVRGGRTVRLTEQECKVAALLAVHSRNATEARQRRARLGIPEPVSVVKIGNIRRDKVVLL